MNKYAGIVILNGSGGSGKDTFIEMVAQLSAKKGHTAHRISTIDPIQKAMMAYLGWDGETKEKKERRMMHEMKMSWSKNMDGPFLHVLKSLTGCLHEQTKSYGSVVSIYFLLSREPSEIGRMVEFYSEFLPVTTALIQRRWGRKFGNAADDNAHDYKYDEVIKNYADKDNLMIKASEFPFKVSPIKENMTEEMLQKYEIDEKD